MKRILSALFACAVSTAFATSPPEPDTVARVASSPYVSHTKVMSVAIYPNLDHSKMHLMVENHVQVPLYVTFYCGKEQLYTVRVGKRLDAFHQKYDVSELKDGDYHIEVSDGGFNRVVKSFHLSTPKKTQVAGRFLTTIE